MTLLVRFFISVTVPILPGHAWAAEIWTASVAGNTVGIVIEGGIEPGDYERFRSAVHDFGPSVRTVYLRSKGGNVVEAMKIGDLIRRLRLDTDAPLKLPGRQSNCFEASPKNSSNCICASACFLVYAAGSNRHGNHLGLHRPYLPAATATTMDESDHDQTHRAISETVRSYLMQMDVPIRFIDLMFSRSSRQIYFVTIEEAERDALIGRVASMEEYLIPRCATISPRDEAMLKGLRERTAAGTATDADRRKGQEIGTRLLGDLECNVREMRTVRENAFRREFK